MSDPLDAQATIQRLIRERDSLARRCAVRFEETEALRARLADAEWDALNRAADIVGAMPYDAYAYEAEVLLRERAKAVGNQPIPPSDTVTP